MKNPVECHIQGVEACGETELGALVACLLEHAALKHRPEERADVLKEAKAWAAAGALHWGDVAAELHRASVELGERGELIGEVAACPHEEIEFSGSMEFESGALVFHVNCRACGRSGSATVTNEDVLW